MPTVQAERLTKIAAELLKGSGASEAEAEIVSRHSVGANLAGHDSHGIIQIPTYIDRIKRGHIVPGAEFEVLKDTPTITVVDGHWGFGYVVSERLMKMTIEKAAESGVAAATVFRQSHVGRVADYPIMATEQGMIGMMTADSGRSSKSVVPFGGREPRLGTNPICIAMPSNLDGTMFIDMATSAVAAGKLGVAVARGAEVPEGLDLGQRRQSVYRSDRPRQGRRGAAARRSGGAQGIRPVRNGGDPVGDSDRPGIRPRSVGPSQ